MHKKYPFVIAISGATGSIYGLNLVKFLLNEGYKVDLIISEIAGVVIKEEIGFELSENLQQNLEIINQFLNNSANKSDLRLYDNNNLAASFSSGSYKTNGMAIVPCSMNTLAAVHAGIAGKLITRAADVTMKEGRSLILAPREMPFNTIHLRNMYELSQAGVKIVVPAPAFYNHPTSIDDMINYVTGKILDALEVPNDIYRRWK